MSMRLTLSANEYKSSVLLKLIKDIKSLGSLVNEDKTGILIDKAGFIRLETFETAPKSYILPMFPELGVRVLEDHASPIIRRELSREFILDEKESNDSIYIYKELAR